MPEIGLLSDVSEQVDEPAQPKNLYGSEYFQKMRAYAETNHDEWWILSAKHGLLGPEGPPIAPYDETLAAATNTEQRAWAERITADLERAGLLSDHVVLVIHAEKDYHEALLPHLHEAGVDVRRPTEGLGMREKLAWYDERLD